MQYRHFSIEEREQIQLWLWEDKSVRRIAERLRRSPSSISREIRRNRPPVHRVYTPRLAHARALEHRTHRGRKERLKTAATRAYVTTHLKGGWSPEQIAGRIRLDHPGLSISHEAIYQYIYAQFHRGGYGRLFGEDLRMYLKRRRKRRVPKGARRCQRIRQPEKPSIENRPKEVETRLVPGHWESDSLESFNHQPGLNTLVERKTGLVFLTRLPARTSEATKEAIVRRMSSLPSRLRRSVTFDNGSENWRWEDIEAALGISAFFAHAYCSWERGTNENTNGLVRWYFPKKTNFDTITSEELETVEYLLNTRPRKRLGWRTPLEVFQKAISEGVALEG